ncbi:hypothetical protein ALQ72_100242, partial [Pseudomonas syringae pv. maculicola]
AGVAQVCNPAFPRAPPALMNNNRTRLAISHFVTNVSALGLDDIRGFNLDTYIPSLL